MVKRRVEDELADMFRGSMLTKNSHPGFRVRIYNWHGQDREVGQYTTCHFEVADEMFRFKDVRKVVVVDMETCEVILIKEKEEEEMTMLEKPAKNNGKPITTGNITP